MTTPRILLILKVEDGEVLNAWDVERDFGDLRRTLPANTMRDDVQSAFKRNIDRIQRMND